MLQELERAFVKGLPSDEQDCIDIFFSDAHFWKEQFDLNIEDATGSDDETDRMINLVLNNLGHHLPDYIVNMLQDWLKDGF